MSKVGHCTSTTYVVDEVEEFSLLRLRTRSIWERVTSIRVTPLVTLTRGPEVLPLDEKSSSKDEVRGRHDGVNGP